MKKFKLALVSLIFVNLFSISFISAFAGGSGTTNDPFQISTCAQLQNMSGNLGASYILINDIDCDVSGFNTGSGFAPISIFMGILNGQNNTIKGLFINQSTGNRVGLFGNIGGSGVVRNLGLEDVDITGASNTGGVAGRNSGTIEKSYVSGKLSCSAGVGGLVGVNLGTIEDSNTAGEVIGTGASVGGLVGLNTGTIANSYSSTNVTDSGRSTIGGLVGLNSDGVIRSSFSAGDVSDVGNTGGFVGFNTGTISNSFYNNKSTNPDVCVRTNTGGTVNCTAIQDNESYFFDSSNAPMTSWDFVNIWSDIPFNFPVLIFQFPFSICGNNLTETGEQCDDGNNVSGDGCSSTCQIELAELAVFLVIDEDSIDNGNPPNFFSDVAVNDQIAALGLRAPLPAFSGANISEVITLHTGEVGDEGWFAPKTIPANWTTAGPTSSGLRNFVGVTNPVGPGLGTGSDPEALLDKILDITPLRATGLKQLEGQIVCAVVYDSDISINYGPLNGSLKGANLGIVAFKVLSITALTELSSSSLPKVDIEILDAEEVCAGDLELFTDGPEPTSSSEPFDINGAAINGSSMPNAAAIIVLLIAITVGVALLRRNRK